MPLNEATRPSPQDLPGEPASTGAGSGAGVGMARGSEPGAGGLGKEASAIGQAQARHDAWAKAAGREQYASDYYPEHFLWLGVKRSGQRHARLRGIDTTAAAQVPGVIAVLTHRVVSLCTSSPETDSSAAGAAARRAHYRPRPEQAPVGRDPVAGSRSAARGRDVERVFQSWRGPSMRCGPARPAGGRWLGTCY